MESRDVRVYRIWVTLGVGRDGWHGLRVFGTRSVAAARRLTSPGLILGVGPHVSKVRCDTTDRKGDFSAVGADKKGAYRARYKGMTLTHGPGGVETTCTPDVSRVRRHFH